MPSLFRLLIAATLIVCAGHGVASADEVLLPRGKARPALVSEYFPDRVHEFVWRNWDAVEPSKIAATIGAEEADVVAIAESMGLPRDPAVPPEMRERGYITLIRRNWHLLPYEQLMELLDMTPEQLSFTLREDDFLWVKLGELKPDCEPLRYERPDELAQQRAAEIREVVESEFGDALRRSAEPRFDFVRQLSAPYVARKRADNETEPPVSLRCVYSYLAIFGDPLLHPELNPYPDEFLQRLADAGVNGIWLHSVLRDLAPGGEAFPEFGGEHERRLVNLKALVARAKKRGIGVYLYMNEPRAMPASFFGSRPEMAGVVEPELTAMCTSHPAVRQWMADAFAHIFREVPDLGGVFAITGSENLTNCTSHGTWQNCEHCKERSDADILVELAGVIEEGVHRSSPKAKVILSDWGWRGHGDAREIVARLPKSTWLISVSEWELPISRGGIASKVGEYSISSVGPGPRAQQHWAVAREAGLKTAAEVQLNNTCELASLPYLPVMDLVAEHCHNLARLKLDGMVIGWTMGGHPSPNFMLAQRMNREPAPEADAVLDEIARERFGEAGSTHARKAWRSLSDAYREYPFHIDVVYNSPVQIGPANSLYSHKTEYRATMWGIPYDDLDGWRGPYPAEVFAGQFEKMAAAWNAGLEELQQAVDAAPTEKRTETEADLRYARAAAICFASVANQARFVLARDALGGSSAATLSPEEREDLRGQVVEILNSEIELARELYALTQEDSRIGFEPSCQYFYLPLDLVEKVIDCRWLLQQYEEENAEEDE